MLALYGNYAGKKSEESSSGRASKGENGIELPMDNHASGSKEQGGKEDPLTNSNPLLEKQTFLLTFQGP